MISKWSIVGLLGGFIFSLFSGIRYFVIWPDEDRAIVYVLIGVIIMSVAWLFNQVQANSNSITAMEEYLAERK